MIPDLLRHVDLPERAQHLRIRGRLALGSHAIHPISGHGALKGGDLRPCDCNVRAEGYLGLVA